MRAHIKIYGQVQGVFFRKSAKIEAEKLAILGWVKNNEHGFVEAMAQGKKENVNNFIKWCKKGPPFAKVESIEVDWREDVEDLIDFSVID